MDEPVLPAEWGRALTLTFAYRLAAERLQRSRDVPCPFGRCTVIVGRDGAILGGLGDPACGCDNLPGWRSSRYEGLPKPGVPSLPRGRHGSRVQRSRARRWVWLEVWS